YVVACLAQRGTARIKHPLKSRVVRGDLFGVCGEASGIEDLREASDEAGRRRSARAWTWAGAEPGRRQTPVLRPHRFEADPAGSDVVPELLGAARSGQHASAADDRDRFESRRVQAGHAGCTSEAAAAPGADAMSGRRMRLTPSNSLRTSPSSSSRAMSQRV